jgi:YggT family protein
MGEFLVPIILVLVELLYWYGVVVFIAVIVSWLISLRVINTYNRGVATIVDILYRVTEPALRPIRRLMPNFGGLDISPIILFAIIFVLRYWLLLLIPIVRGRGY